MFLFIERDLTYLISCVTKIAIRFAQVHPPFPPWESADFVVCFLVSFARFTCNQRFNHLSLRSSRSHVFKKSGLFAYFSLYFILVRGSETERRCRVFPSSHSAGGRRGSCQRCTYFQKSASIQPRTSRLKFSTFVVVRPQSAGLVKRARCVI